VAVSTFQDARERLAGETMRLTTSTSDVVSALGTLAASVQDIKAERVIQIELAPVIDALSSAVARFGEHAMEGAQERKELLEQTRRVAEKAEETAAALEAGSVAREKSISETTRNAHLAAQSMRETLDAFRGAATLQAEQLQGITDKTETAMRSFGDALIRTGVEEANQTAAIRAILPALERSAASMEALAAKLVSLSQSEATTPSFLERALSWRAR
jgi:hypothetical protein